MAKFVQKLQIVEAVQFDGSLESVAACSGVAPDTAMRNGDAGFVEVTIARVAGVVLRAGDWIVTDCRGGIDVMSDDIFQSSYAPAVAV